MFSRIIQYMLSSLQDKRGSGWVDQKFLLATKDLEQDYLINSRIRRWDLPHPICRTCLSRQFYRIRDGRHWVRPLRDRIQARPESHFLKRLAAVVLNAELAGRSCKRSRKSAGGGLMPFPWVLRKALSCLPRQLTAKPDLWSMPR